MPTTATLRETLRQTLEEYLDAVTRQKEENPPDILALFQRLDRLEAQLDPRAEPQLHHYMHGKSYRKAYNFLCGREGDNQRGGCGH